MSRNTDRLAPHTFNATRRRLLRGAALAPPRWPRRLARAQPGPVIRIGYWPVAAGLPFYAAIEKGYFKEAGLNVEALKFAGAQQVMEAMLAGRADGSANGTGSANLAIGEIASPGLFKIFASNPSNAKNVLDEFIVAKDSPIQSIADLKGKRSVPDPASRMPRWPRPCWSAPAQPGRPWSNWRSASTWPRSPRASWMPATRWSPPAPWAA